MREIKFRGLSTDGEGWVYGDLAKYMNGEPIIMPLSYFATRDFCNKDQDGNLVIEKEIAVGGFFFVLPESVGQFTGLKDINGTDIYEGDVITYNFLAFESYNSFNSKIFWDEFMWLTDDHSLNRLSNIEVIGNIHENPELL